MTHVDSSMTQNFEQQQVLIRPHAVIRPNPAAARRRCPGPDFLGALLAVVLLGSPQGARALPAGFGTDCTASGGTSAQLGSPGSLSSDIATLSGACGSDATSSGRVLVPVQTDAGPSLFSFDQNARTTANATAGMGSLRAFSQSESTSSPESYSYTVNGNGAITENEYVAGGNSGATALWWDSLTVGGTPNSNGFIVLEFSLDLHGQASSSAVGASASILSRLFIDDRSRYFSQQILDLSSPGTVSTTIGFLPGTEVQLYGDLQAVTQSVAGRRTINACNQFFCYPVRGDYVSGSSASADAGNTAGFRIDVVTPGGSYSTLSGVSYATPVPEPGTASAFGFGLLGLIGITRWRTRSGAE